MLPTTQSLLSSARRWHDMSTLAHKRTQFPSICQGFIRDCPLSLLTQRNLLLGGKSAVREVLFDVYWNKILCLTWLDMMPFKSCLKGRIHQHFFIIGLLFVVPDLAIPNRWVEIKKIYEKNCLLKLAWLCKPTILHDYAWLLYIYANKNN